MLTLLLAAAVMLLGLVLIVIGKEPWAKIGLITFGCGLLVTLLSVSGSINVNINAHPDPVHIGGAR